MKIIGNIIWFIFGGLLVAIEYAFASFLMCLTIIGIPFGVQTFKLEAVALWPFGKEIGSGQRSSGCLYVVMNVIWILVGGFWIAVTHLVFALVFYVTIIGIPFGHQHLKLAGLAIAPFGKDIKST